MYKIKMKSINRLFIRNRRKIISCLVFIVISLTTFKTHFGRELYWGLVGDVSCNYMYTNHNLPLLEAASLPQKSIFFHETSCFGNLTARHLCAIESAAKAHPTWQINVIFSGNINSETINSNGLLNRLKNVQVWKVNIDNFTKNTPLEGLVTDNVLKKCRWSIDRRKDILKYISLYKWGGVYLDLDVVIAKPLGSLARNWAARENDELVADGLVAIAKDSVGRNVAEAAIRDIELNYKNNAWCNYSPGIMMRVLQKLCSTTDAKYMSSATCNGFEVYGAQFFYPVEKESVREYFTSGELRIDNAYTYYLWDYITKNFKIKKTSPYSKIARRFCPESYSIFFK